WSAGSADGPVRTGVSGRCGTGSGYRAARRPDPGDRAPGIANRGPDRVRIVHVSDIHFWQYEFNPLRLLGKRLVGMASLLSGRARQFRLEGVPRLVERVRRLDPDHILITGD